MTTSDAPLPRSLPAGLALTTCATLLLEISLTRIFSVTMWYHFAFMAISVALFGMAFGAVIVYLRPGWFPPDKMPQRLSRLGIGFGVAIVAAFWLHLQIPFSPTLTPLGMASVAASFLLVAVPFTLSGVIVSLVLTRHPAKVGMLYAFDLVGASLGCLLLWALIGPLTGPGMILASAALAAAAALVFAWPAGGGARRAAAIALALLVALTLLQPALRVLQIKWVKNVYGLPVAERIAEAPMVERWNSHAVITVFRSVLHETFGWGMSPTYRPDGPPPQQLLLTIDAAAGTVITKYTGRSAEIKHLKSDITSLAHHLRPESETLVIGTGGGRDLLTALLFNPKRVVGVEINGDILKLITEDIANFTGLTRDHPKIAFVHDEARSWIERSGETFDIIQASLIDSWAATSAGAFVLTENSLYTVEAWTEFLRHLHPKGVLTMSRWWVRGRPGEMVRTTSLAYAALKRLGVADPRQHVLIAATDYEREGDSPNGVGTILVSPLPFDADDVAAFTQLCEQMRFRVLLTPTTADREIFAEVLDPARHDAAVAAFPLNIAPPSDDDPFFFNMLRFSDALRANVDDQWITSFNTRAVTLLIVLLALVVSLCLAGLVLPLALHERALVRSGTAPLPVGALLRHGLYFAALGLGFILVEISQIQRLTLFLGHPVYSLTVVLFTILLATGVGSWLTGRFILGRPGLRRRAIVAVALILAVTLASALGTPALLSALHGAPLWPRLLVSAGLMLVLGLPLGAGFPAGLALADREIPRAMPWLWATNGGLSVVGSVLAVMLAIAYGITTAATAGALAYALALAALAAGRRTD